MKVCKFGGSSLADAEQLNKVMDIVLADPARRIVVVSAPGKRHDGDTKVTDLLISLANAVLDGKSTRRSKRPWWPAMPTSQTAWAWAQPSSTKSRRT